jgi:hypothetical protein
LAHVKQFGATNIRLVGEIRSVRRPFFIERRKKWRFNRSCV